MYATARARVAVRSGPAAIAGRERSRRRVRSGGRKDPGRPGAWFRRWRPSMSATTDEEYWLI